MGDDEQGRALFHFISVNHEKISKLTTEEMLNLLGEPGDLDMELMMLELFRRNALYRIIERYPEDKEEIVNVYNTYCVVQRVVNKEK